VISPLVGVRGRCYDTSRNCFLFSERDDRLARFRLLLALTTPDTLRIVGDGHLSSPARTAGSDKARVPCRTQERIPSSHNHGLPMTSHIGSGDAAHASAAPAAAPLSPHAGSGSAPLSRSPVPWVTCSQLTPGPCSTRPKGGRRGCLRTFRRCLRAELCGDVFRHGLDLGELAGRPCPAKCC